MIYKCTWLWIQLACITFKKKVSCIASDVISNETEYHLYSYLSGIRPGICHNNSLVRCGGRGNGKGRYLT